MTRLRDPALGEPGADAAGAAAGRRGERARGVREMGPRLRHGRPGDRQRRHGDPLCRRGGSERPDRAGQRQFAGLSAAACPDPGAAAGDRPRRQPAARPSRRAAPPARQPGSLLEALDLRAVRPRGHGRHGAAAGRRCRGDPDPRQQPRPGADHRLHAPLLPGRSGDRRPAGGRGSLAQSLRGRRAAARGHRLPELRQPREPGRDGPVHRLPRGHGGRLPGARLPDRVRQRLVLQRDRRPGDSADARDRRARPDRGRSTGSRRPPGGARDWR